jgi:hypothetical protein
MMVTLSRCLQCFPYSIAVLQLYGTALEIFFKDHIFANCVRTTFSPYFQAIAWHEAIYKDAEEYETDIAGELWATTMQAAAKWDRRPR